MNFGMGNSVPQENGAVGNGNFWIRVTPEKPIVQRSNSTPVEAQVNQPENSNWNELLGIYTDLLQDPTNNNRAVRNPNSAGPSEWDVAAENTSSYQNAADPCAQTLANNCSWSHSLLEELLEPVDARSAVCTNGALHRSTITPTAANGSQFHWDAAEERNWGFNLNADSLVQTMVNYSSQSHSHLAEFLGLANAPSATSANRDKNKSSHATSMPMTLHPYSQDDGNLSQSIPATSVLTGHHSFSSFQRINGYRLSQLPTDEFPVPCRHEYNLNSPPRSEPDAASSATNSLHFAPVTPAPVKQPPSHRFSETLNSSADENSSHDKDKQENLSIPLGSEAIENTVDELLQNIVDSSSAIISPLKEKTSSDEGVYQDFDLNKTPQQKPPKRRKHRPKVVVEGKPKRAQKVATPTNNASNENPNEKRKYVRRKGLKTSAPHQDSITDDTLNTPVDSTAKSYPTSKRKHVHRKGLETSTPQDDVLNEISVPDVESTAKSCRRALSFNLENESNNKSQNGAGSVMAHMHQVNKEAFNLNFDSHGMALGVAINNTCRTSVNIGLQNRFSTVNPEGTVSIPAPAEYVSSPAATTTALAKVKDHTLNRIAHNVNRRHALCQSSGRNGAPQVHQHIHGEETDEIVLQGDAMGSNSGLTNQLMLHQQVARDMNNFDEQRGSKRNYSHITKQIFPLETNMINSPNLGQNYNGNIKYSKECSETHKKKKIENGFVATTSNAPYHPAAVNGHSKQVESSGMDGVHTNNSISHVDLLNSYVERDSKINQLNNGLNGTSTMKFIFPVAAAKLNSQKQHAQSEVQFNEEQMAAKGLTGCTQAHHLNLLNEMISWHQHPSTPPKEAYASNYLKGVETFHADMLVKKQIMGQGKEKVTPQVQKYTLEADNKSLKGRGSRGKKKIQLSIDEITHRLQVLDINKSNETHDQEQTAIVPYNGISTIVPFDPVKKRKPRPKVDLDPETDRLWKLLMGKEGTESTDKDKEKWWEEERRVFRGRADSFIARMHLVQGDRRFSRWKGSVVDSVIGVFLTQNVSDHLSSSAFMALAAKFPLKSNICEKICYQSGAVVLVEEPEVQIVDQECSTKYHEKISRWPSNSQSTITCSGSSENIMPYLTLGTRIDLSNEHNRRTEEEIISTQNHFDTFFQTSEEIKSCSGSNSEAEDQTSRSKPVKKNGPLFSHYQGPTPMIPSHTGKATMFRSLYSHESGGISRIEGSSTIEQQLSENARKNPRLVQATMPTVFTSTVNSNALHVHVPIIASHNHQLDMKSDSAFSIGYLGELGDENKSHQPSTVSGITKAKGLDSMSKRMERTAENTNNTTTRENGAPRIDILGLNPLHSMHTTLQQANLPPGCHVGDNQYSISSYPQERFKRFHQERTSTPESKRPPEMLAELHTGNRQQTYNYQEFTGHVFDIEERTSVKDQLKSLENKAVNANEKEHIKSTKNTLKVTDSKRKKEQTQTDKWNSFDWDSLRKQVLSDGKRRERSKDAMDSLDYEAVRCADVKEISNAIKERGMNNMLAERIKEFLNRLVQEHGSIDLEWLREVSPDKTKDYLLSIRGLGLKSVECVRLLTLHHLAFPVDTNVGRIAVRLGWVPLQPLPESLQLHLLEMYPVLESIQKYLWPRLCKLDQRTLYELHYQMITFGKVFCTKSKPNCNACPMRGECRHFASAFASARLALPGPEEKSIVSSVIPVAAYNNPSMIVKPMLLPPSENNSSKDACFANRNHEPIIEEPATPEPETKELTESDIEEAFYTDPDEIPTIKLNIEEFTSNLHHYMQKNNMELQEGDMSKALVALNTEVASIPATKLKNVSRLRTEHQVYELPDSHPLLKGFDKREPDDPSPYLLAIWTPGETANSIQPPERRCDSQESGQLCNDYTCFSCNSIREANSQTVRGTILIPCRTATRGSFPLNGTYFQVNEMFADHESSLNPIDVPRAWIWNLPRRTVYFGTSVSTIFKGLSTEGIQYCFWKGFVCVRGFDQKKRAPRPLKARLHFPASKLAKTKNEDR